jgi:ATP-dependent DNA helicase RecQ
VARIHGRFGIAAAAKLLRGDRDPRIAGSGLDRTPTFGILSERDEDWLLRLLRRCVTAGWVDFSGGDRPVVVLTGEGRSVMRGERPARLLLPPARTAAPAVPVPARRRPGPATRRSTPDPSAVELDAAASALFEALRRYRLGVARSESVPPYVIAGDRSLRDIAVLRPRSLSDLQLAHGIGPSKAERYGEGLLAVVRGSAGG